MTNYGKKVVLVFDREIKNYIPFYETSRFRLVSSDGDYIYPVSSYLDITFKNIVLEFEDFNNIPIPTSIECLGCIYAGSDDIPLEPFISSIYLHGLWPIGGQEYLGIESIVMYGEFLEAPPNIVYGNDYLGINSITMQGSPSIVTFVKGYVVEYLGISSITMSGQYCDINGNPL